MSEDPYSNHQLLPVLYSNWYRPAWEAFCQAFKFKSPNRTVYCSKEVFNEWLKFCDIHTDPPPPKETPQPLPKQKEPKGKSKEPTMTDIDTQKLFRQAVAYPSNYDGSKKDFTNWWLNMQLYLLGYASISDEAKIIAIFISPN